MSVRSFATTAAIAATTLVAAGGVVFAIGASDTPTIQSEPVTSRAEQAVGSGRRCFS